MRAEDIWPLVRLDSIIFDTQPGFARSPNTDDSGVPQLRPNNVSSNGNIELSLVKYVDASPSEREKYGVGRDDVIFNNTNSPDLVGRTACFGLDKEYVISNHMTRIRVNETLIVAPFLARYLHYLWMVGYSQSRAKQWVNQAAIDQKELARFQIPLPPLSEQRRIVDILHQADELRRLRRQADELVQDLPAALFDEMFGNPVQNPKGWATKPLSEVGQLDRGRSRHRPRDAAHLYGGPYPFIQTGDVANSNGWITEYHQTYSEAGLAQSRLWPEGTLCITIAANIAKTGILTFDACFPDSIVGFLAGPKVKVEFVRQWFEAIQGRLEAIAPQAAQKNINLRILREIRIPVPPIELQEEFATNIAQIRSTLDDQEVTHEILNTLFQSLLTRAFTGELTAAWRERHAAELAAEARQRDEALGLRARVVRPVEPEVERVAVPLDETHPRYTILHELSSVQQQVYQAMLQTEGYFSAENLMPDSGLSPDIKRRTLTLLELLGLVARVSLPSTPTSHTIFYVPAHRASQATDDGQDDDLATLKAAFSELGI